MTDAEHVEILNLLKHLSQSGFANLDNEFHLQWYVNSGGDIVISYDFIDTQERDWTQSKKVFDTILEMYGFNNRRRQYKDLMVVMYYWGSDRNYSK